MLLSFPGVCIPSSYFFSQAHTLQALANVYLDWDSSKFWENALNAAELAASVSLLCFHPHIQSSHLAAIVHFRSTVPPMCPISKCMRFSQAKSAMTSLCWVNGCQMDIPGFPM